MRKRALVTEVCSNRFEDGVCMGESSIELAGHTWWNLRSIALEVISAGLRKLAAREGAVSGWAIEKTCGVDVLHDDPSEACTDEAAAWWNKKLSGLADRIDQYIRWQNLDELPPSNEAMQQLFESVWLDLAEVWPYLWD